MTQLPMVDLPEPDSPTNARFRPGTMPKDTSSTALTSATLRLSRPRVTGKYIFRLSTFRIICFSVWALAAGRSAYPAVPAPPGRRAAPQWGLESFPQPSGCLLYRRVHMEAGAVVFALQVLQRGALGAAFFRGVFAPAGKGRSCPPGWMRYRGLALDGVQSVLQGRSSRDRS